MVQCGLPSLPGDGPGVPMNVVRMNDAQLAARGGLSILSLQFEVVDDRPDWPVVRVLVDGQDPFAAVVRGWRGFDPEKILGSYSPLLGGDAGRPALPALAQLC